MEDKTNNVNQYTIEDIVSVESVAVYYIENGEYQVAYEMIPILKQFIALHANEMTQNRRDRYKKTLAQLQWAVIERLNPDDVVDLFSNHLEFFFNYDAASVQNWVERVMVAFLTPIDRDVLKQKIRSAIKKSVVVIGAKKITVNNRRVLPTVQNWIHDYELFVGKKDAGDHLFIAQYLNTSSNISVLQPTEYRQLEELLRFYISMGFSSLTPQGNEDPIVYHDVESGHIIMLDHGKEIDTGVTSDIVAKMTPEERAQAKKNIQQQLQEINQALDKADLPLTSLFVEQISRNQELQKAITDAAEPVTKENITSLPTPRLTLPEQPLMPPAPKKVEPVQAAAPTPAESIPVATAQKTAPIKPVAPRPVSSVAPLHIEPIQPIMPEPKAAPVPVAAPMPPAPTPAPMPMPAPAPQPTPATPQMPRPTPQVIAPAQPAAPAQAIAPAPTAQQPLQKKVGVDYQSLAELVLAEHALLLASIEAENRFLSLIAAFAKGERTRDEVITTLTTPIESGGVNLTADIAASCLNTAERFTQSTAQRMRQRPQLQQVDKTAQPTFQQVSEMMQRHKDFDERISAEKKSVEASAQTNFLANNPNPAPSPSAESSMRTNATVEDIFANLDVAQMQQRSVKPETDSPIRRIDSIRTQQPAQNGKRRLEQVMGPMEELKRFSIAELRAFGTNPDAATAFIKEKIDLQTQESISKRAEAIRAWQESPLHQLYVQIGNASLTQGTAVNQYIDQQQQSGKEVLTVAEFEAIASLNRQLRF